MRALVVSTDHPEESAVFDQWVRSLLRDGWDVLYAAPFADFGVKPHDGIVGLDLPTGRGEHTARIVARSILARRGPEADLVVVSSDGLAEAVPVGVHVVVASHSAASDLVPGHPV